MKWRDGLIIEKDANSVLDWRFDWSRWLSSGDSLFDHSVISDNGITVDSSSIVGNNVVVWLSGGNVGTTYDVTVRVITSNGRTDDRTVRFKVLDL